MTRARNLSKLATTNTISVDSSNNVGINSTIPDAKLDVIGIISATKYYGDGSELTGITAGATLSDGSGDQKVVLTSKTSGVMDTAATDADLSWNSSTNTLSAPTLSGNITGTAATFTGNVSVGGTLTYDDVTNVDSVGVITARTGIKVGAGESISAVSGTLTYYGDGSNLTGVELGTKNFVASGTIDNGATVIIKDDGTVGIVTQTTSPADFGNSEVFEDSDMSTNSYCSVVYDTDNNKIVISYADKTDSAKGKAVVGTISGTSITFGTPVEFNSSIISNHAAYVGSGKVVIAYQHNHTSYHSYAIVGTVSGTGPSATITFGNEVVFNAGYGNEPYVVYDSDNDKAVILFRDGNDGNYGKAIVGTVSGTGPSATITFGTEVNFNGNGSTYYFSGAYIGSSKIVVAFVDGTSVFDARAKVGTVSGTGVNATISFGSDEIFNGTQTGRSVRMPCISIGSNKVVIAYQDIATPPTSNARVGTVSGTTIGFGITTTFVSGNDTYYLSGVYNSTDEKVFLTYRDTSTNYGTAVVGNVVGTEITFGSPVEFNTNRSDYMGVGYDSTNNNAVIGYVDFDNSNNNYGTAKVYSFLSTVTNLTTENYIGIAGEAIANAATGKVNVVGGVNSGQSGLTTAQTYYVGQTGILTTTADTPSVVAGTSISDTKILVWRS